MRLAPTTAMTKLPTRSARRVALYARKSTTIGVDNQIYNSVDAQLQSCRDYVACRAADGWQVAREYSDLGVSGATLDRPGFNDLMRDVRAGQIDVIVAYRLDRISRSLKDFLLLQDDLQQQGVSIAITSQSIDNSTNEGRLNIAMYMAFAQYDRETIATRIRDKAASSAAKGLYVGGRPPYGYRRGEKGKLVTEPAEGEAVRFIFERYIAGDSRAAIIAALDERKAPVPLPHGYPREGAKWTLKAVLHILRRQMYSGVICCKGAVYPGQHEAFVSLEGWEEAARLLTEELPPRTSPATRHTEIDYALKGILRCPLCGAEMVGTYSFGRGHKLYRFYRCPHHRKDALQRCTCGQISASKIEEAAAEQIRRLGKNPRIVNSIVQQLPMLASYNVPALLAKAPNLISHIPDAAMKELFRLVYKRIAFNPATGAFQAECHNI